MFYDLESSQKCFSIELKKKRKKENIHVIDNTIDEGDIPIDISSEIHTHTDTHMYFSCKLFRLNRNI